GGIETHRFLVTRTSPALPPAKTTLVIARVALPVLLTVSESTALVVPSGSLSPFTALFRSATDGAVLAPTPASCTTWGELVAVPKTTNCAVRLPSALGVKVIVTPHELPGGTALPAQLLAVTAKSAALVPMSTTLVIESAESP